MAVLIPEPIPYLVSFATRRGGQLVEFTDLKACLQIISTGKAFTDLTQPIKHRGVSYINDMG